MSVSLSSSLHSSLDVVQNRLLFCFHVGLAVFVVKVRDDRCGDDCPSEQRQIKAAAAPILELWRL